MNLPNPLAFGPCQLRRVTGLFLALWTLAVAASVVWNVRLLHDAMLEAAAADARSDFDKDVIYRKWAALHGGVYVPVTARTPPNPYLTNVLERDLVTPSGRRLTLIHPIQMTRQVLELETQELSNHGHITTLKRLNPESAPDAWEAAALRAFEQGQTEVESRELLDGEPYLRLMKPLVTEAACLKCHAAQGHHAGDILGGLSIAVPLAPYQALAQARIGHIAGVHAGLWALGAMGIFLGRRQMRQRLDQQLRAEAALRESENRFRSLFDASRDAIMTLESPDWKFASGNPATVKMFGARNAEHFTSFGPGELSPERQPDGRASGEKSSEMIATALREGSHFFEWTHRRINGDTFPATVLLSRVELAGIVFLQATVRDITESRQAEDKLRQLSRAVEQSPATIMITDPAGDIEYVNPKFTQVSGYTLAEVLGKNPRLLKSGETSPEAYRELWHTMTAGKEWHGEFHNQKKSGELYWERASISPILDGAGRITHYVAVKEDITVRKQAEAERDQLVKDLQIALANVKSLSGLLPICAGCKKIRDDKGYWNQVDTYISKHSEATFTHGLCPACIKKWYPELPEPLNPENRK